MAHARRRPPPRSAAALAVAALWLAGCAGAPAREAPEYAAWVKQKQAEGAANQEAGCLCGSLARFRDPS